MCLFRRLWLNHSKLRFVSLLYDLLGSSLIHSDLSAEQSISVCILELVLLNIHTVSYCLFLADLQNVSFRLLMSVKPCIGVIRLMQLTLLLCDGWLLVCGFVLLLSVFCLHPFMQVKRQSDLWFVASRGLLFDLWL